MQVRNKGPFTPQIPQTSSTTTPPQSPRQSAVQLSSGSTQVSARARRGRQSDEAITQTSTTLSAIAWGLVCAWRAAAVDDSVAERHARAVEAGRAVAAADAAGVDLLCVLVALGTYCVCWICCVRWLGLVICRCQDSAITVWW
jgi:hypothetical protein